MEISQNFVAFSEYMNFTNLNDLEALITLSSQQTKDLFFCFAQTFRIPHTVRLHTSIIIKEEVVISIFWKKNVKNASDFDLKLIPFHHVKSKATQCRNERFVKTVLNDVSTVPWI